MAPTVEPLTPEQIETRGIILYEVDDQRCQGCGRDASQPHIAEDAGWFVDSEAGPKDATGEPITLAIIRCPDCW